MLVATCLVNQCEISNLHKFNLEFQKYHKADGHTILRSERAATDSLKTLIYNILVNGFLFITIFAQKNGLSENMIFYWILELTFKDNSDNLITNVLNKALCSTSSKNLFFSKSGILNRRYGSLKKNLHSVVHQDSAGPFTCIFVLCSFTMTLCTLELKQTLTALLFEIIRL